VGVLTRSASDASVGEGTKSAVRLRASRYGETTFATAHETRPANVERVRC